MASANATEEATLLFADLSGFTALTEAHGDLDAADVAERFYEIATRALAGDARLVKTIGDAVMAVSRQPPVALATAVRLAAAINAEPRFPAVRIGIHAGPVICRGGDYFGATVNLAARVAGYARAGQILCTAAVVAAVGLDAATFRATGMANFKNVVLPVPLFEVEGVAAALASLTVDPVCRMCLDPSTAPARVDFDGRTYHFCCTACADKFAASPESYRLG